MLSYASRRLGQALLALLGLAVAVALLVTAGGHGDAAAWLTGAARLDFGRTVDGGPVTTAVAAALPATVLLVLASALIGLVAGWGGGLLLALAEDSTPRRHGGAKNKPLSRGYGGADDTRDDRRPLSSLRISVSPWRMFLRGLGLLADIGQGTPTFWLGGVLVVLFSVGLGALPPGGIVDPALPAFGAPAYLDLWRAQPAVALGDLLGHLALPALTLTLAGLATRLRLVTAALPVELGAPHTRVARAAGLSRRRVLWRAARPALPVVVGGAAAGLAPLAGALVLVEYLFGWPGLGLLAYHAARAGDTATLGALLLLFGLVVVAAGLVADLVAAWADPQLRRPHGAAP